MFASKLFKNGQESQIVAALADTSKYASRSVAALAKVINESESYTAAFLEDLVDDSVVDSNHTGSRSGKAYYSLAGGN